MTQGFAPGSWVPDPRTAASSRMGVFAAEVAGQHQAPIRLDGDPQDTYRDLHAWSVARPDAFWDAVWRHFDVVTSRGYEQVVTDDAMPATRWFTGSRLNYVDQVLRHRGRAGSAVVTISEDGGRRELTWPALAAQVSSLAAWLRAAGVGPGHRVVGYLTNAEEAVVAFLATAATGATWAGCGPDYGASAAADRLAQLRPSVLVGTTAYRFGGVVHDRRAVLADLAERIGVGVVVAVEREGLVLDPATVPGVEVRVWDDVVGAAMPGDLETEQVGPDHALWVLFSSGTTGVPKGILHGHAGVVATHLAFLGLHLDLRPGDAFFWYTTTNWMLWNVVVSALMVGATTVAYEGSPMSPTPMRLWEIAAEERVVVLGTSPGHLLVSCQRGLIPGAELDLSHLRQIGVTGAPAPAALFAWVAEAVADDVPVFSVSGGTDVVGAFVGGSPLQEVRPGRISGTMLGAAAAAFDDSGTPVTGVVGELVVTQPTPSMPVAFWGDEDRSRLREAYFEHYPGVWRHGDWVTHHADGSWEVHGRSDSTLNRHGVRLGSADLYAVVEDDSDVAEALVLGVERPDGSYRMPLFLVAAPGRSIDDDTVARLRARLRVEVSPRHVPDEVHVVPGLPHTRTGKKLEVPLKRILQGADPGQVLSAGAVDDPSLIDYYVALAAQWDSA